MPSETFEQGAARVRQGMARQDVIHALAYDVWHYERPNQTAVVTAAATIKRVQEAAEAMGYRLVFERAEGSHDAVRAVIAEAWSAERALLKNARLHWTEPGFWVGVAVGAAIGLTLMSPFLLVAFVKWGPKP